MLIGLCGYTRAGKDTVADYLVSKYGFGKRGFADALKNQLRKLNPVVGFDGESAVTYVDAYARHGDECRNFYPEVRRLEQVYGTNVCRASWGDDCWIDKARQGMVFDPKKDNVFKDVRFDNEVEFITGQFGRMVWVEREGCAPINSHSSEQYSVKQWCPYVIENNGTLDDLYAAVDGLVEELREFDEQLGQGLSDMMSRMLDAAEERLLEGTGVESQAQEDRARSREETASDSVLNG